MAKLRCRCGARLVCFERAESITWPSEPTTDAGLDAGVRPVSATGIPAGPRGGLGPQSPNASNARFTNVSPEVIGFSRDSGSVAMTNAPPPSVSIRNAQS